MTNRLVALSIAGLLWPITASSHHNASSHYLLNESASVEGMVTDLEMINPHARLHFTVTTETGEVESWMAEGNSQVCSRAKDGQRTS